MIVMVMRKEVVDQFCRRGANACRVLSSEGAGPCMPRPYIPSPSFGSPIAYWGFVILLLSLRKRSRGEGLF